MNNDSVLFNKAKDILRKHHNSFADLKTAVKQLLIDDLNLEPSDDVIEWLSYIIRSEDWKSFSEQRIREFERGDGKDFIDWLCLTITNDEPTDKWFKPYIEKEDIAEARTLVDMLTVGMRTQYWASDKSNAQSCLKSAIALLKTEKFEPAKDFTFADYFVEMVNNGRYSECCDLVEILHNIVLDDLSKERILAQAIGVSMQSGRLDITRKAVDMAGELNNMQRDILPFNLACYYATAGNDEDKMYDYIQLAVKNGKCSRDFDDSDFDSHRHKIMFKTLISGGTKEDAEVIINTVGSLGSPKTLEEAITLISGLRAVMECEDGINIISKYLGVESESYGFPEDVPLFDDILKNFGHELPPKSLVDIFVISFPDMDSNYQSALDVVGRLSGSVEQIAVADAFIKAGENYDAGHRAYDDTVHDQLIENYFPHFNDDSLIYLLEICDTQYLAADWMSNLFIDLLSRNPSDDIKQRAYDCLVSMYQNEGVTDYYFQLFSNLFNKLNQLLPRDTLEKIKSINPEMWKKFALDDSDGNADERKTGFTGTLIKENCDYAIYVYCDKAQNNEFELKLFWPDGTVADGGNCRPFDKKALTQWYDEFADKISGTMQYVFMSGDKKVDSMQQGDRVEIDGRWTYKGGFNKNGELVFTVTAGDYHIGIHTYAYVGFSKDGKLVFKEKQ